VEPELVAKIARTGARIYEVGISTTPNIRAGGKRLVGRTASRLLRDSEIQNVFRR